MREENNAFIVGKSEAMRKAVDRAEKFAQKNSTVLLTGETGVGKEVFAEYIHENSERRSMHLVKVHIGGLSEQLIESELFGHSKGAYTGAEGNRSGQFELAQGGTLFLDEVDEVPYKLQVKLLRAIENKEFYSIGNSNVNKLDVRFIAATKVNLRDLVREGKFRADLLHRLEVFTIEIPPLRERRDAIADLIEFFLRIHSPNEIISISDKAHEFLTTYSYPGNVRELKNMLDEAITLYGTKIDVEAFERHIQNAQSQNKRTLECEQCFREMGGSLPEMLAQMERTIIQNILKVEKGNKSRAASALGVPNSTFLDKCKKLGLEH